jgi:hypothetical protein
MKVQCIDRKGDDMEVQPRQAAFVHRFAQGCGGEIVSLVAARKTPVDTPWCIRGMKFGAAIQECWQTGRTFYYIDNGYFGNAVHKRWFRIIKNHSHNIQPIIARDRSRLDLCDIKLKPFAPGKKILVAPPSEKSLTLWDISAEQWVQDTVTEIRRHTDRPIEIRMKRPRAERFKEDTMEQALADNVHCLVTYNSVAACEAIMLGKPAIALGPNAAGVLCSQSLSEIENPLIPTLDQREAWLRHLSYSQFTFDEMSDGTAWHILQENYASNSQS